MKQLFLEKDIVYTALGLKDQVTVYEGGKETMTLKTLFDHVLVGIIQCLQGKIP